MSIDRSAIRDLLLPGLRGVVGSYSSLPAMWAEAFEPAIAAPHIWVPKLSIPQAVALGAAAAIIKNPEVTRRFWAGWFLPN